MDPKDKRIADLIELAKAQNRLIICYRCGYRPSDKTLDTCNKYKELVNESDT